MIADDFKQHGSGATVDTSEQERCRGLEERVYRELSALAFGNAEMSRYAMDVQRPVGAVTIIAKTFMNGVEKPEGQEIPVEAKRTPEEAVDVTLSRMNYIVAGKGLYWRIRPHLVGRVNVSIGYPGERVDTTPEADKVDWYVRIRLGIEDVDTWRRPETQG